MICCIGNPKCIVTDARLIRGRCDLADAVELATESALNSLRWIPKARSARSEKPYTIKLLEIRGVIEADGGNLASVWMPLDSWMTRK